MANSMTPITQFDSEKMRRVEELLENMKQDASQAETDGDVFMLGVYQQLLKVASPILLKAHARVEREANARVSKARKELLQREREARKAHKTESAPHTSA